MKKKILILSILLLLGFNYSSFNSVKLLCEEQKPQVLSPGRPSFESNLSNLLAEEQKPQVLSIIYSV